MKCPICNKGVLKKQKVPIEKFETRIGTFTADVCSKCGEQIFSSEESAKIENKIKELGLWGMPVTSRIYKVGGNFVVSIKKTVALKLGINKPMDVFLVPDPKSKRLVVEIG